MASRRAAVLACAAGLFGAANTAAQMTAQPWQLTTQQTVVGGTGGVVELQKCNNATGLADGQSCSGYTDLGTSTTLAAGLAGTGTASFGSANLAMGEVKLGATGPTYSDAGAGAGLRDSLLLSIPGLDPGEVATIGIRFAIDGFFADGAQLSGTLSAIAAFDRLVGLPTWRGTFVGGNTEAVSSTSFALADAPAFGWTYAKGSDWTGSGPSIFEGEIDVWGSDPFVTISLWLAGSNDFDLLSAATIDLILPPGTTFTSDSGVFLAARQQVAVPAPAGLPLVMAALGAMLAVRRRAAAGRNEAATVDGAA